MPGCSSARSGPGRRTRAPSSSVSGFPARRAVYAGGRGAAGGTEVDSALSPDRPGRGPQLPGELSLRAERVVPGRDAKLVAMGVEHSESSHHLHRRRADAPRSDGPPGRPGRHHRRADRHALRHQHRVGPEAMELYDGGDGLRGQEHRVRGPVVARRRSRQDRARAEDAPDRPGHHLVPDPGPSDSPASGDRLRPCHRKAMDWRPDRTGSPPGCGTPPKTCAC